MDIEEKAKMYAEGRALEAITSAIEEAYANGYRDGYHDGISKADVEPPVEIVDGITYVNLRLPSGRKWSYQYLKDKSGLYSEVKKLTYEEASKLNIPTKKDYLELIDFCKMIPKKSDDNKVNQWDFLDKSKGKHISLLKTSAQAASSTEEYESFVFWLRDDNPEGDERLCADGSSKNMLGKVYMGYKLPIMLVK